MQEVIISILIFLVGISFLIIYNKISGEKRLRFWLKQRYGKIPERKDYDFEKISCYWDNVKDNIPEDEKLDDITWNDLEMNNIFTRINQCNSFTGEQILYSTLHHTMENTDYVESLEEKITFFSNNSGAREDTQVFLHAIAKKDGSYSLPLFLNNLDVVRISKICLYRCLQILLVASFLPAIISKDPVYLTIPGIVFLINAAIYTVTRMKYEVYLDSLTSISGILAVASKIAGLKTVSSEEIFYDFRELTNHFKKLSNHIGQYQQRKTYTLLGGEIGIIVDYFMGATFIDFIKYDNILRMIHQNQKQFMELYHKIGELDMAISIASFRESIPFYCTPSFQKERNLQIVEIYHPLVENPVCNSVGLENNCIITGSNASGKSTFIKAVGINSVLAQSIHTCTAKEFVIPRTRVLTSMAVRDDLMAGESYYIKEIKYLKRIIESLNENRMVICCIDEILRGTNTEERIAASAAILRYLDQKNCIAIVASHDIQLLQMLNETYDMYHFREQIDEKDISFDYKIHEGISYTKNAINLLQYVDFPNEIIEAAKKYFVTAM